MSESTGPTLTDAKGMGGVNAQDGFEYQVWDALLRLPAWLRTPVFEGMTAEGLEDIEARFFAPHAPKGHILDRFQAKSASLTRGQIVEVFRDFAAFDAAHPDVARVQTLVTPTLPRELQWLERDTERVHRARPFYAPFADVLSASEDKLTRDIVATFGEDLGPKIARSMEVGLRNLPDRRSAVAMFAAALDSAFPELNAHARKVTAAFEALERLVTDHRGALVDRGALCAVLAEHVGGAVTQRGPLRVHLRSDRNSPEEDAVEIDASGFSLTGSQLPTRDAWRDGLLVPLERTARWANARREHRLRLTGSYRISTGFAAGWAFRAATGFELEVATRKGYWATDERPRLGEVSLSWHIGVPERLRGARLAVSIGVLRDPTPEVVRTLGDGASGAVLSAYLDQPITNGRDAQQSAQRIKSAVVAANDRLRPASIDLYFAGPAALAVAIGHRWNAMPSTQLHEFRQGQGYLPSVDLADVL